MYITKTFLGAACCLGLILTAPAFGSILEYQVTVNTSTVSGTTGYMDVALDPGTLGALGVTAVIGGFTGATLSTNTTTTTSGSATNLYFIDGDVFTTPASAPTLLSSSNTLTLENTNSNNELTQALEFGTTLSFILTLSGPGVSLSGGATSISGTNFVLDFLNDAQTAYELTTDTTGSSALGWAVGVVEISNTGLATAIANPSPNGLNTTEITAVPEVSSWVLSGTLLLGVAAIRRRRQITS